MWAGRTPVAALLPLRDPSTTNAFASSSAANNVRAEVVEREFGGSIRRGKGPFRLKANPLHRKAERAVQAFS
jgi:hypothetical protein